MSGIRDENEFPPRGPMAVSCSETEFPPGEPMSVFREETEFPPGGADVGVLLPLLLMLLLEIQIG